MPSLLSCILIIKNNINNFEISKVFENESNHYFAKLKTRNGENQYKLQNFLSKWLRSMFIVRYLKLRRIQISISQRTIIFPYINKISWKNNPAFLPRQKLPNVVEQHRYFTFRYEPFPIAAYAVFSPSTTATSCPVLQKHRVLVPLDKKYDRLVQRLSLQMSRAWATYYYGIKTDISLRLSNSIVARSRDFLGKRCVQRCSRTLILFPVIGETNAVRPIIVAAGAG